MADGVSYDTASREVVAEAMVDMLEDSTFVEQLAKKKTIFEKIVAKLKEFLENIKSYFAKIGGSNNIAQAVKTEIDGVVKHFEELSHSLIKLQLQSLKPPKDRCNGRK